MESFPSSEQLLRIDDILQRQRDTSEKKKTLLAGKTLEPHLDEYWQRRCKAASSGLITDKHVGNYDK